MSADQEEYEEYTIKDAMESLDYMRDNWGSCAPDEAVETLRRIILEHGADPLIVGSTSAGHGVYADYPYGSVIVGKCGKVNSVEMYEPTYEETCRFLEVAREVWSETQ